MKIVTANRLSDGAVIYAGEGGAFVERLEEAARLDAAAAQRALELVLADQGAIAAAYLVDADATGPIGREALRETIRAKGPTVRPDLGKQGARENERL